MTEGKFVRGSTKSLQSKGDMNNTSLLEPES